MLKQLMVSELLPGMMVTQVIEQHGPVKIRKVGFIRSNDMIKGLTEMGVTLVEVDLAQSLNTDNEELAADSSNTIVTATQRLVATDKKIADVDRQLSQQFHRSLFLPAVDQMPSKWMLYGKPYSILAGICACGLTMGIVVSFAFMEWIAPPSQQSTLQASNPISSEASQGTTSPQASGNETTNDNSAPSTTIQTNNITTAITPPDEPASVPVSVVSNNVVSEQPTAVVNTIKGVALEDGQQVFGYQPEIDGKNQALNNDTSNNDEASNNSSLTNPVLEVPATSTFNTEDTDVVINPDLMKRIQAAVRDVDNETVFEDEPALPVTDLRDLPRIDQLSSALLTKMPDMSFSAHMYASNPRDRWVRVNSRRVGEGEIIAKNVILKHIAPEKIVLELDGQEFTMNALSDW